MALFPSPNCTHPIHPHSHSRRRKRKVSDLKLRTPRSDQARRLRLRFGARSRRPRSLTRFGTPPSSSGRSPPSHSLAAGSSLFKTCSFAAPDAFTLVPTRRVPSSRRVGAVSGRLVSPAEATRGSPRAILGRFYRLCHGTACKNSRLT